ncbi:hypothetical protein MMPV_007424 [Pyropia vietnamensis]
MSADGYMRDRTVGSYNYICARLASSIDDDEGSKENCRRIGQHSHALRIGLEARIFNAALRAVPKVAVLDRAGGVAPVEAATSDGGVHDLIAGVAVPPLWPTPTSYPPLVVMASQDATIGGLTDLVGGGAGWQERSIETLLVCGRDGVLAAHSLFDGGA